MLLPFIADNCTLCTLQFIDLTLRFAFAFALRLRLRLRLQAKVASNPARKAFWEQIKAAGNKVAPISSIECSNSVVSTEAAQAYLEDVAVADTGGGAADDAAGSDDDLLDDL